MTYVISASKRGCKGIAFLNIFRIFPSLPPIPWFFFACLQNVWAVYLWRPKCFNSV